MNRGLIEARFQRGATQSQSGLPRFMNRGLIEAGFPSVLRYGGQDFPDS